MFTTLALPAINHILRRNGWALERLERHAGKTARIECAPASWVFTVLSDGTLGVPGAGVAPNVVIRLTPGSVLRLIANDERAWSEARIDGDSDFATALDQVWRSLDWGLEEDMSRVFGDIAAHRIATAAKQAREAAVHALDSAARNLVEYWTEEQPLLAHQRDVDAYNQQVDALRDDVARLEKRIAALGPAAAESDRRPKPSSDANPQ